MGPAARAFPALSCCRCRPPGSDPWPPTVATRRSRIGQGSDPDPPGAIITGFEGFSHVPLVRNPHCLLPGRAAGAPARHAARVLPPFRTADLAGVCDPAGGGTPWLCHRGGAARLCRQPRRHDEGRAVAGAVLRGPHEHAPGDGVHRADRPARRLDRARADQEPDHRGAGDEPRALAHAPLRAAPEPRLLPERLRRPGRQQGHPDRPGVARVGGAGDRRHLVRGRAVGGRRDHLRRRRLAPAHPAGGLARGLRRRAHRVRAAHQGALHRGIGGAIHAGGAHRRQLHQHPHGEALRPRRARGRLRARRPGGSGLQVAGFAAPRHGHGPGALLAQRHPHGVGERRGHLAVGPGPRHHRGHRRRHKLGAAHHRHVGVDPVGRGRHLREHGRGAGGHGDHLPPQPGARPAGQQGAGGDEGRHPLRSRGLPLRPAGGRPDWSRHGPAGRGDPRLLAAHRGGREGGPGRPLRRGQVHARQPAAALLRPGVRAAS